MDLAGNEGCPAQVEYGRQNLRDEPDGCFCTQRDCLSSTRFREYS